jgi:hypothetical protein
MSETRHHRSLKKGSRSLFRVSQARKRGREFFIASLKKNESPNLFSLKFHSQFISCHRQLGHKRLPTPFIQN